MFSACGKESSIKTHVEAERLGDGENITQTVTLPLSDKVVASYSSGLDKVDPFFRGIVGTIMNLGASFGAGKQRLTITQPVPKMPERLSSIKIKRIFFLIDTPKVSDLGHEALHDENKKKPKKQVIQEDFDFIK